MARPVPHDAVFAERYLRAQAQECARIRTCVWMLTRDVENSLVVYGGKRWSIQAACPSLTLPW
jgi:hypothetical protein